MELCYFSEIAFFFVIESLTLGFGHIQYGRLFLAMALKSYYWNVHALQGRYFCPPLDSILTLMTVWRITEKIIRTLPLLSYMHIKMESS